MIKWIMLLFLFLFVGIGAIGCNASQRGTGSGSLTDGQASGAFNPGISWESKGKFSFNAADGNLFEWGGDVEGAIERSDDTTVTVKAPGAGGGS